MPLINYKPNTTVPKVYESYWYNPKLQEIDKNLNKTLRSINYNKQNKVQLFFNKKS